jgi:hypothetical protein
MDTVHSQYDADENKENHRRVVWRKIMEVAFWGTVIWGLLRMVAHFFGFTPDGVRSFSRPLLGLWGEGVFLGTAIGTVVLFLLTVGATAAYAFLFARSRLWWGGLVYGFVLMMVFGLFFRIGLWREGTLSTELAWFLSLGLFIGMTLVAEQTEEE